MRASTTKLYQRFRRQQEWIECIKGASCASVHNKIEAVPWPAWQRPQQQPAPPPQLQGSQLVVPALLLLA